MGSQLIYRDCLLHRPPRSCLQCRPICASWRDLSKSSRGAVVVQHAGEGRHRLSPAYAGGRRFSAVNLQVCLGRRILVLVMVEGAPLVLVTAVAIYQYVAAERVLVLYAAAVSGRGPRCSYTLVCSGGGGCAQPTSTLRSWRTDLSPEVVRGVSCCSHVGHSIRSRTDGQPLDRLYDI